MTFILAIDQGTSGTKAIVVDEAGAARSLAEVALSPRYLEGGGVEQDPEALFESVVEAGRRAVAEAGVSIAAVALANQGETVLAWDRATGRPLSAAVVWQDRRAEAVCEARRDSAARVAELTGLVLDPYFSAPKLRWLRDHVTTEGVVTTTDTWLVHRLCGAFVTDVSTASRSLVLDLDDGAWSDELLALFGLESRPCPRSWPATTSSVRRRVRRRRPRHRADRGPAGGTARRTCLDAGHGQVHLRHRRVPARPARRRRGPLVGRPDHVGGLAAPRPHVVLRRRPGLHGRVGGALGQRARPRARPPTSSTPSPRRPATGCSASLPSPVSPPRGGTRRPRPRSPG